MSLLKFPQLAQMQAAGEFLQTQKNHARGRLRGVLTIFTISNKVVVQPVAANSAEDLIQFEIGSSMIFEMHPFSC